MVTETSLVAQLPSPVAVAALRSALPMGCREATLEAFVVGLVVDPADYDLVDHDRDPDHAHVDAWWPGRENWLCRGNLCRVGRVDRDDPVHRSSCYGRQDCESGCVHSRGLNPNAVTHASPLNGCGIGFDSDHVLVQACRTDCGRDSVQIGHYPVVDDCRRDDHGHSQFGDFEAVVDSHHALGLPDGWADVDRGLYAHQQMTLSMSSTGYLRYRRAVQVD